MHHYKLLCDFNELNWIFAGSRDFDSFLEKIVSLIVRHIKADRCAIYLYDEKNNNVQCRVAEATSDRGVEIDEREHEISKKALEKRQVICYKDGKYHSVVQAAAALDFKEYCFLAVPISRGINKIGALVLYRKTASSFTRQDIQVLQVLSSQLANILENAFLLLNIDKKPQAREVHEFQGNSYIKGRTASEGLALGQVKVLKQVNSVSRLLERDFRQYTEQEFLAALKKTENQLESMQKRIEEKLDDAASLIFTSHLLILKDPIFLEEISNQIAAGLSRPKALLTVAKQYIVLFSKSPNPYVKEKIQDVEDLVLRILGNLEPEFLNLSEYVDKIVVASDLYPSDLLKMATDGVAGVIQVRGGVTSHISILARSLRIPLVIIDIPELLDLKEGIIILLDADSGEIFIEPDPDLLENCCSRLKTRVPDEAYKIKPVTLSKDRKKIRLFANINLIQDLHLALQANAEGIGLYRTEFPFLIRNDFPSEEEQYVIYKKVMDLAGDKEIWFRTLDIGGDKIHSYYKNFREENPFLGMRSIRFSLVNLPIFKQQVRAILRAAEGRQLKIMFPMVSSLDEFKKAKAVIGECALELQNEGYSISHDPQLGIMIEVPSLVSLMEEFTVAADFFSIGTNDFVQYMLGVDRTNEKVADYYVPHHPAVLRSLYQIVKTVNKSGKDISICGEMAHHLRYIPFLLGIGIRAFSMDVVYLKKIQDFISQINIKQAEEVAKKLLEMDSVADMAELFGYY